MRLASRSVASGWGDLPSDTSPEELRRRFGPEVVEFVALKQRESGLTFAFVGFTTAEAASEVRERMDESTVFGATPIKVMLSKMPKEWSHRSVEYNEWQKEAAKWPDRSRVHRHAHVQ